MKNLLNKYIPFLLAFSMTVIITLFTSCDNNNDGVTNGVAPVITEIINYEASPNDTIVNKLVPGQWVVLKGANFKNAVKIAANGISIQFDSGLFSDTYAVVQIPSVIPFPSIPENQLNTIEVVTPNGSTIFNIDIVAGPPGLMSISNENPVEGEVVTIFGTNLFLTSELVFAGTTITDYTETDDGTSISFVMPNIATSGPFSITTASGTASTVFNMNSATTEGFLNFDGIGSLSWGTGTSNSSTEFPGNHGYYAVLNNSVLNAGDGVWWGWERSINTGAGQWIPTADLNLNVDQYALKFEINVPGEWNGTSILILKDYDWKYVARYEPWKVSETKTANVTTDGKWTTVTIPLTEFRTKKDGKDGTGDQAASLTELLGTSGNGSMLIYTANSGSTPTATGFRGAIDNIRIVKIKE
ncbi:glycan-binding surface protein [Mariniflexile sp. HMF6888]|uniref:glycan-binding surface protein n=1 Tax=Mariniflexile sp. HMF6888 TaxID=3373086 RepID=UPI0037AB339F